jgi:phosphoribosyl 1,2-cyclic phosphodiesterase
MANLAALFVTHEHSDHVKGIPTLARRLPSLPVYVHEKSYRARRALFAEANRHPLKTREKVEVGAFSVHAFPTHHDAFSSHGFSIIDKSDETRLCLIPDTGHICDDIRDEASQANILFIECDYDRKLLATYPNYSNDLKARISGPHGHLSNDDALDLLESLGPDRFRKVVFTHLSPRTNSPEVLQRAILARFGDTINFEIAPRNGSTMSLAF